MYMICNVYSLFEHSMVRFTFHQQPSAGVGAGLPPAINREVYLPTSGNEAVDHLQAAAWALADVLRDLFEGKEQIERDDQVDGGHDLEMDEEGRIRVRADGPPLHSTSDSPQ